MKTSSLNFKLGLICLVFGFAAHRLLKESPPGINWLATIMLILVGAWLALPRASRQRIGAAGAALAAVAVVLAAFVVVRDSPTLTAFNILGSLIAIGLLAGQLRDGASLANVGVVFPALRTAHAWLSTFLAPLLAMLQGGVAPVGAWQGPLRKLRPVLVGAMLATPLLCIFTLLFASADAAFEQLIRDIFRFNLQEIVGTAFWAGVLAWLLAGLVLHAAHSSPYTPNAQARGWLGTTEVATALSLIAALFGVFVALQFRYLFSAEPIGNDTRLNEYADHARRGFFELVMVAALALTVLLSADWLVDKRDLRGLSVVRLLGVLTSALVFVIIISAMSRMVRYSQAFGLTELRVYTSAFMLWIACMFFWLAATVLRGRRRRFAIGALVSGTLTLLVLNAVNVDGWIVRYNLGMAAARPVTASQRYTGFDAVHAGELSTDAYPDLFMALDELPPEQRCQIAFRMRSRLGELRAADARTFNFSRAAALALLEPNAAWLDSVACASRNTRRVP